jgi:ParB family transcriptional regulator, chromosome partitioning protein
MALKDKAAKIDFSAIGLSPNKPVSQGSKTAIGMHADALFRDERVAEENSQLKAKLDAFEGASPTRSIDANLIVASRWANRHELSFQTKEFAQLKAEIESAGGNIQPIKVRPTIDGKFEIIFGHRRHRACLELGIPVLATVDDVDDVKLFCDMDRENRERQSLRPYETGVMYARALDEGLFPSARKLADAASIDLSQLGKALALARLPKEIIEAFASPLELQYRWVSDLNAALQKDPDLILSRARELSKLETKEVGAKVLKALLHGGGGTVPPPRKVKLSGRSGRSGELIFDAAKGHADVQLKGITLELFDEIEAAIRKALS